MNSYLDCLLFGVNHHSKVSKSLAKALFALLWEKVKPTWLRWATLDGELLATPEEQEYDLNKNANEGL